MTHLDAYLMTKEANAEPMNLELTPTQRFEIAHYVNNPLAVILLTLDAVEGADMTLDQIERLKRNAARIRDYIKGITK